MLLVSAPVAFVIWLFRDTDKRADIENARGTLLHARQEMRLEDRQKWIEWACSDKPDTNTLRLVAVAQLGAYAQGRFGQEFRENTFVLLLQLWADWVRDYLEGDPLEKLKSRAAEPYAQALTRALAGDGGATMRQFKRYLPDCCLAGMNFNLPGMPKMDLSGCDFSHADLRAITLQYANLKSSRFWAADLSSVEIGCSDLSGAAFAAAVLKSAYLDTNTLNGAFFHGSILDKATLVFLLNSENCLKNVSWKRYRIESMSCFIGITGGEIHPLQTHQLRLRLRDQGLELDEAAYAQYQTQWNDASESQRDEAIKTVNQLFGD